MNMPNNLPIIAGRFTFVEQIWLLYQYHARIFHALEAFPPMSQRVISPLIPSLRLSKGWRPVLLTERVGALL